MLDLTLGLDSPAFGTLAALALRSAALLALGWLGAELLERAAPPARQALWASVLVGVLLLPLLAAVLPAWRVLPAVAWPEPAWAISGAPPEGERSLTSLPRIENPIGVFDVVAEVATPSASASGSRADWRRFAVILWGAGGVLVALFFALGLWRLRAIRRGARRAGAQIRAESARLARELGVERHVRVLFACDLASPATWGLVRPVIVLPRAAATWSGERLRLVLAHEMAHVARCDFAWRLVAQLGCVTYWFNPLAWLAARRLRLEQELACDLAVVAGGARPSTYARHLLSIARGRGGRPLPRVALDMARRGQMEGRLMSILENRSARSTRRALLLPVLLVSLILPVLASAGTRLASATEPSDASPPAIAPALAPAPVSSDTVAIAVPASPAAPLPELAASPATLAAPAVSPSSAAAPLPVLAATAPVAPSAAILDIEPALAPALPSAPRARREMEVDPESRRFEEEIARRAEEIAELVGPLHEEIARAMEEEIEPILERMELVQLGMEPVHEEMSRIGAELSEALESELETQTEAEELQRSAEAVALEALKRARLGEALADAEGGERARIEQALRAAEERLAPLRVEMEAARLRMAERQRASAEEMRARLEPYHARMAELRERLLPDEERMEQLRAELEPLREELEASREARMHEVRERLETLRQELEMLRREREAERSGEEDSL